jgi:SAM-dependent methyltransferase
MKASDIVLAARPDLDHGDRGVQDRIASTSKISAHVSLSWRSSRVTHIDSQYFDSLNVRRDFLPLELESQFEGSMSGSLISHGFAAGEALSPYSDANVHRVGPRQFNRDFSDQVRLEPRLGRFYPKGIFENIPGNFSSNYQPCRITCLDDEAITTDFNHPLAQAALDVDLRIVNIRDGGQERGGRCNDIIEMLTSNGPGMQGRYRNIPTDFWSGDAFARTDASPDDVFYTQPRLVDHLDRYCSQQIGELYSRLLPHEGEILDLMASWVSHLPDGFAAARITGLGLNRQELEHNPLLADQLVHDLNQQPQLPFGDQRFDGIVCTASVEYLIKPAAVFGELARILKPGAPLVITFSNRWFPPKAIRAWGHAHEFERMGLVLEYFFESGQFDDLHSYSLRGLPRPPDDGYSDQLPQSDPVFAVWGLKR